MNAPRWWRLVGIRGVRCPLGHHIPNAFGITEDGYVRCDKFIDAGSMGAGHKQPRCNKVVFLISVRGGGNFVVEVTEDERDQLMKMSSPFERLTYLGIGDGSAA